MASADSASEQTRAPSHLEEKPVFVVTFEQGDPEEPKNWSKTKKHWTLAGISIFAFIAVFGSSSYAPGERQIQALYGVNEDVASTGLTVYVLGFAFGPLLWGPLSEMYGKRPIFIISWILMTLSIIPSAFAENITVIMIFRLLTGVCAACALSNGAGVPADLYPNDLLSLARATGAYSFCALSGPCFGSLIGFFVAAHSGRPLWVVRLHFFMSVAGFPFVFLLPETYSPKILEHRAEKLRKAGQTNARAMTEIHAKTTMQVVQGHVVRPLSMIAREPIVQGAGLWISLAYGIIYFFFEEYPVVFIEQHDIDFQLCGLMFLGIAIGMALAVIPYPWILRMSQKVFIPGIERRGHPTPPQENSLKAVISAVILMPVSLFWFAWSSGHSVYWLSAALAGVPFGYATVIIFFSFVSYMTHVYGVYATSAQSANTFVRSIVASTFPIAAHSINRNMGTKWGVSMFAFISLGLIPIPLVFLRYGPAFRARSHFAAEAQRVAEQMRAQKDALTGNNAETTIVEKKTLEGSNASREDVEAQKTRVQVVASIHDVQVRADSESEIDIYPAAEAVAEEDALEAGERV